MNRPPKSVATTARTFLEEDVTVPEGDAVEAFERREGGHLLVCGHGTLARTLARRGLVASWTSLA